MAATLKVDTITNASNAGTANLTLDASGNATVGNTLAMGSSFKRNRIINGDMRVDQRNAGASVTIGAATVTYTLDRFYAYGSQASKFSVQQNAGSVTPPVGFTKYLGVTSLSAYSVGAGDIYAITQAIEGFNVADLAWGTANAKTVTLSFQVYSSLTGTFGGSVTNGGRSYPFAYSIPVANTWTTIFITIPGDTNTGGTWATNNTVGIYVVFGLGVGSTFSGTAGSWSTNNYQSATGATSVVGTNGATFYITGVQLEVGSVATPYERQIYSNQLIECMRYYQKWSTTAANQNFPVSGQAYLTNAVIYVLEMPVTPRVAPTGIETTGAFAASTATYSVTGAGTLGWYNTGTNTATLGLQMTSISGSGLVAGNCCHLVSSGAAATIAITGCEL